MSVTALLPPAQAPLDEAVSPAISKTGVLDRYFSRLTELTAHPAPWNRNSYIALASIFLLWGLRFYSTWATWGDLSIDCGHEMYLPAMLTGGKVLYRDLWYGYTPLAPYFNSLLFRIFGIRLEVLYWAGSLSALSCAILLFMTGRRLSSPLAGWTAGAVLLFESFHARLFSFPLPYGFPAVYGCLTACFFLWCIVNASHSENSKWLLAAGTAAALALLAKVEYGAACYLTLALVAGAHAIQQKSWKRAKSAFASAIPGLVVCLLVAIWMLSIGGFKFITQENLTDSWPWSYFMKTYGKLWLDDTGLALNASAFLHSLLRTFFLAAVAAQLYILIWRRPFTTRYFFCFQSSSPGRSHIARLRCTCIRWKSWPPYFFRWIWRSTLAQ